MPQSPLSTRTFTWPDLAQLAALQGKREQDLQRWLGQPNLRPERDCLLALRDAAIVDYAYVVVEQPIRRGVLLGSSNDPGAARALIDNAMDLARSLGLEVLHVDVPEDDADRRAQFVDAGMAMVRTHHHMVRPGGHPTGVELPANMATRLATPDDAPAVAALQNAAFTGSWGYCPNTVEEIAYRIFELPNVAPDPVVLLEVDGVLRSYCWTHREDQDSPGMVGMVGVAPDQQNNGYGKLATAAGIDHLVAIGAAPVQITVDSANAPAIHVYGSLGFELDSRSVWYEARVS